MSRKLPSADIDSRGQNLLSLKFDLFDSDLEVRLQNLIKTYGLKTTYTGIEFRNEVVPMGKTKFWKEQKAGRLQVSRSGRNVLVTGRQAALYLLSIQREGELHFRNAGQIGRVA